MRAGASGDQRLGRRTHLASATSASGSTRLGYVPHARPGRGLASWPQPSVAIVWAWTVQHCIQHRTFAFFLPPQPMNFHDEYENESAGESSTAGRASTSTAISNMQLAATFAVHNARGSSRITNVHGDYTTHINNYVRLSRDRRERSHRRRRRAMRTADAAEEGNEALSSTRRRTRAPESESQRGRADSPEDTRKPSMAAAAVSIQLNLALRGPPYEGQIDISCRVVAVSTGALVFFLSDRMGTPLQRMGIIRDHQALGTVPLVRR